MRRTLITLISITAFTTGAALGCKVETTNVTHCHHASGDQTCADLYGDERPFCVAPADGCANPAEYNGCVGGPPPDECYSPCGNSTFAAEDSNCLGTADETGGETGDGSEDTESGDDDHGDPAPLCGDGLVEGDEQCDDANLIDSDECTNACTTATCGDAIVQASIGEMCDDGARNDSDVCNVRCQVPGTLVMTASELVDGGQPVGIRATFWNGRPTAVIGGYGTIVVWELESESLTTFRLRSTEEWNTWGISGALGLETGELLVSARNQKSARWFGDDLTIQREYWSNDTAPTDGFVGIAPIPGGAMLASKHVSHNALNRYSAWWVVGLTNLGAPLWNSVDLLQDSPSIYLRDMRSIAGNRAVVLSDLPSGSRGFRVYDSVGNVEVEVELPSLSGGYRQLCGGQNGFFLFNRGENALVGFDAGGSSTFNTSFEFEFEEASQYFGADCAVRSDMSPMVAATLFSAQAGTTTLEVIGFSEANPTWHQLIDFDGVGSIEAPAILLEESESRAWVFGSGQKDGQRAVYVAVIAI